MSFSSTHVVGHPPMSDMTPSALNSVVAVAPNAQANTARTSVKMVALAPVLGQVPKRALIDAHVVVIPQVALNDVVQVHARRRPLGADARGSRCDNSHRHEDRHDGTAKSAYRERLMNSHMHSAGFRQSRPRDYAIESCWLH